MQWKTAPVTLAILATISFSLLGCTDSDPLAGREAQAKALLRERLGANIEIHTESVAQITWPNRALGCPQADQMYAQVLMEGYRIVLRVDDHRYAFHGGAGSEPFYCANPQNPIANQ